MAKNSFLIIFFLEMRDGKKVNVLPSWTCFSENVLRIYNIIAFFESVKWRGGEWYLEKRGSRKILAGSQNLGSVFDTSRSLVFSWFAFTF